MKIMRKRNKNLYKVGDIVQESDELIYLLLEKKGLDFEYDEIYSIVLLKPYGFYPIGFVYQTWYLSDDTGHTKILGRIEDE